VSVPESSPAAEFRHCATLGASDIPMPHHRPRPLIASRFLDPAVVPEISCIVSAKTPLGFDLPTFVAAAQRFIDEYLGPVWGVAAHLKIRRKTQPGCWALVFVDTERQANDDGWHDVTNDGLPLAKVFLRAIGSQIAEQKPRARAKALQDEVTLTVTHEIAEMLVDPAVTLCVQRVGYGVYSLEVADAVEEDGFRIDGFKITDFVYPAWYEQFHKPDSTVFDQCGKCRRPFHVLRTGYASIFRRGRWTDHAGSPAKRARFEREDRNGHRTEQRTRSGHLKRSTRR
jgi:hypothetical protein